MTLPDTRGQAQQGDSPADPAAGQTDPSGDDAAETPQSEHDAPDDDQDGDDDGKDREAAKLRKRAQKAERERDELAELVNRQRQAIIDREASAANLTERHITAADITVESMLDEETGLIDAERLSDAVNGAVREFGVRNGRPPAPNPQQGRGGGPAQGTASWSNALKGR